MNSEESVGERTKECESYFPDKDEWIHCKNVVAINVAGTTCHYRYVCSKCGLVSKPMKDRL